MSEKDLHQKIVDDAKIVEKHLEHKFPHVNKEFVKVSSVVKTSKTGLENRRVKPWEGKARTADKLIIAFYVFMMIYGFAMKAVVPMLLAKNPVFLGLLSSSTPVLGAAGAFAKVNDTSLILPIVLASIGSVKFMWLLWWAGRRWGSGIIEMMTPSVKLQKIFIGFKDKKAIGYILMLLLWVPFLPLALVAILAGWQKMNLVVFMVIAAISRSVWIAFVVLMGYELGQTGVDIVMIIDKYSLWISIGLVVGSVVLAMLKARKEQSTQKKVVIS